MEDLRRTPSGVRGLKCRCLRKPRFLKRSHPVRGAWIEMPQCYKWHFVLESHPVRGAWIEI